MRWPVLFAAALLLLPGAMFAAGMRAGVMQGAEMPVPHPRPNLASLWSGSFQRDAAAWFSRADPALPAAVALRNQTYFSLLRQSADPDIVIGRDLQLLETVTLETFCRRTMAALPQAAEIAATRLAALQAWYAAQGRVFIYLLTPNKIGPNPDFLPKGWPCRGGTAARIRALAQWRAMLQRHGIRFVDGPAIITNAGEAGRLYPRGGTHWNWIGASLVTQAFVAVVNQARPGALAPFTFTTHDAPPGGTDRDLTDLLNLPFPRLDYPAPQVELTASEPVSCHPPFIAEIGGSFTFSVDFLLARLPCPPKIALYTYFQVERASFAPFTRGPADPAQRRSELRGTADVVVLEENEDVMFQSRHAKEFWELVEEKLISP